MWDGVLEAATDGMHDCWSASSKFVNFEGALDSPDIFGLITSPRDSCPHTTAINYTDITQGARAPCAHLVNAQFKAYSSGLNSSGCLFSSKDHCTPSCAILLEKVKGSLVFLGVKPSCQHYEFRGVKNGMEWKFLP